MKRWLGSILGLVVASCFVSVLFAEAPCVVQDEEEYVVMAAVLFPHVPDVPEDMKDDLQRKAYLARTTVRLDGFYGSSYTVEDEAATSKVSKGTDPALVDDFNKKNGMPCKIDGAKLMAQIPPGKRVTVISAEEVRKIFSAGTGKTGGWDEFRKKYPFAGGITRLSRPGFNTHRTKAMIEATMQAGWEMGVGYHVYLEKSAKTGKWVITGNDMTRMY